MLFWTSALCTPSHWLWNTCLDPFPLQPVVEQAPLLILVFAFLYSQFDGVYAFENVKLGPRLCPQWQLWWGGSSQPTWGLVGGSGSICFVKNCFYALNKCLVYIKSGAGSLLVGGWVTPICTSVGDAVLCPVPDPCFPWQCCRAPRRDLGAPLSLMGSATCAS